MESAEEYRIYFMIFTGMFGMFMLAVSLIVFLVIYQKKVMRQQLDLHKQDINHKETLIHSNIQVQEEERKRIARDLHDNFGVSLSVVKFRLYELLNHSQDQGFIRDSVYSTNNMIDEIISDIRKTARNLLPTEFKEIGLSEAVSHLIEELNRSEDLDIYFHTVGLIPRMEYRVELSLYRIVQESLNNAVKHAEANQILVEMGVGQDGKFSLKVKDDGRGFSLEQRNGHSLGLQNIENRARMIGANVQFLSGLGNGTEVVTTMLKT
ncbi:sensor histidine kinase [bacterium SCSIO 12741]|nr:sensor histidine kinase [bacterium SCSIO 12741]